jgi:hypothetical protein
MKVLSRLKKFYKEEASGKPHVKSEMFELAWDLADILEDYATHGDEEFAEHAKTLRSEANVVNIDIAVNMLHRELLNHDGVSDRELYKVFFSTYGGEIIDYLLNRE